jgi:hypothetical protein
MSKSTQPRRRFFGFRAELPQSKFLLVRPVRTPTGGEFYTKRHEPRPRRHGPGGGVRIGSNRAGAAVEGAALGVGGSGGGVFCLEGKGAGKP